jgi:hypothetical protein
MDNREREKTTSEELTIDKLTPEQKEAIRDGILPSLDGFHMVLTPRVRKRENLEDFLIGQTTLRVKEEPELLELTAVTIDEIVKEKGWDEYFDEETIDIKEKILFNIEPKLGLISDQEIIDEYEASHQSLIVEKQIGDLFDVDSPLRRAFGEVVKAYREVRRDGLGPTKEYLKRKKVVYRETYKRLTGEEPPEYERGD